MQHLKLRRIGPYGPANIEVMERIKKWADERNLLESATLFAISHDNHETTPAEQCGFDACMVVSKEDQLDGSIDQG